MDAFLRRRAGQALSEDEVMQNFVQVALAVQHIHSKAGTMPLTPLPATALLPWLLHTSMHAVTPLHVICARARLEQMICKHAW